LTDHRAITFHRTRIRYRCRARGLREGGAWRQQSDHRRDRHRMAGTLRGPASLSFKKDQVTNS